MEATRERELTRDSFVSTKGMTEAFEGTNEQYWATHRFMGTGPKFLKLSAKKVMYRWGDVLDWLETIERMSTQEAV